MPQTKGLEQEIWTGLLLEDFIQEDTSFLLEAKSFDEYVNYNTIHLSMIGARPDVVKDKGIDEKLEVKSLRDQAKAVSLNVYHTTPTPIDLKYTDKLPYEYQASVIKRHQQALRQQIVKTAAYEFSPNKATFEADGKVTLADIYALAEVFNRENIINRTLVLDSRHLLSLQQENINLFHQNAYDPLKGFSLAGFNVFSFNGLYCDQSGVKKAENTAIDASKHVPMSFAFGNDYAWRALGDATVVEENSAQLHGKILGFGMHFGCGMLVGKCYGLFEKKSI